MVILCCIKHKLRKEADREECRMVMYAAASFWLFRSLKFHPLTDKAAGEKPQCLSAEEGRVIYGSTSQI